MIKTEFLSFDNIKNAYQSIEKVINKTPVMTSSTLNNIFGNSLFLKCENFQKVGAFKYRGASNAVSLLSQEEASKGVATHSSGNHAAALALAAKIRGIKSYIVMPENSPEIKKNAVAGYGAEIIFCESTLKAREEALNQVVERTGATFIHPYNNVNVIAGQGTCALEFLNEIPDLDYIFSPLGGGGLLSGTLISAKSIKPKIKVIGCEPKGADDAYRSLKAGKLIPSENPKTIADGLLTSLGSITYEIVTKNVDDILTATEENIISVLKLVYERMKIIIEPSSAVPLACMLDKHFDIRNKKIGIIISGGNVDLKKITDMF